jgi:hypothetical protein
MSGASLSRPLLALILEIVVMLFDEGETGVSVSTWPQVILLDIDHLVGCGLIEVRFVELLLRFLVCLSNPRTKSAELTLRIWGRSSCTLIRSR